MPTNDNVNTTKKPPCKPSRDEVEADTPNIKTESDDAVAAGEAAAASAATANEALESVKGMVGAEAERRGSGKGRA